jgi:hypothetical protein
MNTKALRSLETSKLLTHRHRTVSHKTWTIKNKDVIDNGKDNYNSSSKNSSKNNKTTTLYLLLKFFAVFECYIIFFGLFKRPMTLEHTEGSETSARKIQTLGNHPKEILKHFIFFGFHVLCHFLCFFSEINLQRINIFKHFVILHGWTVGKTQCPVITEGKVTCGGTSMLPGSLVT